MINLGHNHMSKTGAEALARELRAHWKKLGHVVEVRTELFGDPENQEAALYGVRSNLVNGLPPGMLMRIKPVLEAA